MDTNQRRDILKQLAASAVLGSAGIGGLLRDALANGTKPVTPGMYQVKGMVTVNGKAAVPGMAIGTGDSIVTGANSEAIYVIGMDAFLQRDSSVVQFGQDAAKEFFRVVTGRVLSVFGKGEKRLVVPTATIGIRGTACYIEAEPQKVYFCLCYGEADIGPNAEPGRVERIKTTYHDHPINIHQNTGMPSMANAEVINHTDQELIMLEWLCRRQPPFYGQVGGGY